MKILIDECLPRKLKWEFSEHEVQTVPEAGWSGKKNGELLRLMSGVYDVFVTVDSNMQYQQVLKTMPVGFLVLSARNNTLEALMPLMERARIALQSLTAGQVVRIAEDED
jgi:predicted nuclease of predicted toxin-antitoxin system